MRRLLAGVGLLIASTATAQDINRIAFGSCSHQDKPQPIWTEILADRPDLFIFLGDNVYADTDDPLELTAAYDKLSAVPGFARLRREVSVIATWDDHDYGQNDIGREYAAKEASRRIMLDFFDEPPNSLRRTRPDGIYTSYFFSDPARRIQVILLDLRWNRSPLEEIRDPQRLASRTAASMGPYEASLSEAASLLGESQWQWLEQQLQEPASLRIIGSSIQLLAEFTGWETWANFPRERQRFLALLERYQQQPVLIISGDVHWAELSEIRKAGLDWPLVELTSSGLTEEWTAISPNRHRVGRAFAEANYGLIDVEWQGSEPVITLRVKNSQGDTLISHRVTVQGDAE